MTKPIEITSMDDERVAVFRDVRDADLRGRDKFFMAESELVIRRLLRTPDRIHALFLSHARYEALQDLLASESTLNVFVADVDLMTQIAGFRIHRGVLAAGFRPSTKELSLDTALGHLMTKPSCTILIAEGFTNVDNMGALFRNAAAFGADGIVLDPACCDPLYRKAIRVSMGHTLSVPYAISEHWPEDLNRLKREWGVTLVAAEVIEVSIPVWEMPRSPKTALLFGSEGHGLSPQALAASDVVCAIPMTENVPSLNVAVASSVFLYELLRGNES